MLSVSLSFFLSAYKKKNKEGKRDRQLDLAEGKRVREIEGKSETEKKEGKRDRQEKEKERRRDKQPLRQRETERAEQS